MIITQISIEILEGTCNWIENEINEEKTKSVEKKELRKI